MQAGGGQGDENVARLHVFAVEYLFAVDHADAETGQVVLVFRVEAGHFGGFAAHQRAAGLHAALADALDDVGDALGHVLAAGDVVEEQQRLCPAADHVVDAHGHAVDAHGVVFVHQKGDLQLRAHAVRAGDQHRAGNARQVHLEQAAEAADALEHAGDSRARNVLLHQFHGAVSGGDVHTGLLVALTGAFHASASEILRSYLFLVQPTAAPRGNCRRSRRCRSRGNCRPASWRSRSSDSRGNPRR